jgi:quinol monooxygenase YgiN
MIFIAVKFPVRPERADEWLDLVDEFTRAVRAEEGNLFFEWSRSIEEPNTFVLLEGFRDAEAGQVHVQSEHFQKAIGWMPDVVAATPQIVNFDTPQQGWGPMGEVQPRG